MTDGEIANELHGWAALMAPLFEKKEAGDE